MMMPTCIRRITRVGCPSIQPTGHEFFPFASACSGPCSCRSRRSPAARCSRPMPGSVHRLFLAHLRRRKNASRVKSKAALPSRSRSPDSRGRRASWRTLASSPGGSSSCWREAATSPARYKFGKIVLDVTYDVAHLRVSAYLHSPGSSAERKVIDRFYRDFYQEYATQYGGEGSIVEDDYSGEGGQPGSGSRGSGSGARGAR